MKEETGLSISRVQVGTILNVVDEAGRDHYVTALMVGDAQPGAVPLNAEPAKCAGWVWHTWEEPLPTPHSRTVDAAFRVAFDPFVASGGRLLQDPAGRLPPYCCCILHEAATGAVLLEQRGTEASVAAGRLTCFGGKREPEERPLDAICRELREELGVTIDGAPTAEAAAAADAEELAPSAKRAKSGGGTVVLRTPRRAVDLYVDGELIAWFFEASAPARDAPLQYEAGRAGVWLEAGGDESRVSDWHVAVLAAWRRGEHRADFETPPNSRPR